MSPNPKTRKARFLRALAAAGLSQNGWARLHEISPAHLSLVINGHRDSISLCQRIEEFVKEQADVGVSALAS